MPSCKKDKALDELIIGKWQIQSITQVYYENNVRISEYTLYSFEDDMSLQFVDGGTGIIYQNTDVYGAFTWTLSGSMLSIDSGSGDITHWDIALENDILTWSFEESEVVEGITQKYEYIYSAGRVG
jgi:hypothetical protein